MARQWNSELYIDGKWVSDDDLPRIEVINPATEELIGSVPEATPKTAIPARVQRVPEQWPIVHLESDRVSEGVDVEE